VKTAEVRKAFLDYFASKGHSIVASSSLVPAGDPTLLFSNAGMVQFKDTFLGTDKRPYVRATTCQKCLRISGKHNDLENVGRTARHHTFFEMLGNFSFGDYFKEDAIKFAWEFLTEVLKLDKQRLWVTVYKEDDEAEVLWKKHTDVNKDRVLRFGKEDNFWAMGDTGPCGPCSEIHYFLGDNVATQSEDAMRSGDPSYIEIWNLVFMQFNRLPSGEMQPLPKPSVDTGMGLERICVVKQGVKANYDNDLLRSIISFTEKLSGKTYLGKDYNERSFESDPQYAADVAMRVIADHSRAVSFLIADGVNPSSDGRGYVLRRLIRRACRHGRALGFKSPFLYKVAGCVVELMSEAYPELQTSRAKIEKLVKAEEEKFLVTLDTGLQMLEKEVEKLKENSNKVFSGSAAFTLHDTYGFPLDLTEDILRPLGVSVDAAGFDAAMESQRERSRQARASSTDLILQRSVTASKSKFVGYEYTTYESKVVGVFSQAGEVKTAKEGDEVAVVVEETPFYAESGGQVGDTGAISSSNAALDVIDTQKVGDTYVHICRVTDGEILKGDSVRLQVTEARRKNIRINHSATHLLHLALREVLGDHVKQAGSRVSAETVRFDFSHFEPITAAQIAEIERIVNSEIQNNNIVQTHVLPIDEAKKIGAMALFGEKYGDIVRVVQIGDRSKEFCGGTHALRSGDIGMFSLLAEGGISAGVRRVEGVAGVAGVQRLLEQQRILKNIASTLKSSEADIEERIAKLLQSNREMTRELERLGQAAMSAKSGDLSEQAVTLESGTKVIATVVDKATPKQLREIADDLRGRMQKACIALGSVSEGKAIILTAITDDLAGQYHAGNLIREISKVTGGTGGGRADMAQAGGGDPEKLGLALKRFQELL